MKEFSENARKSMSCGGCGHVDPSRPFGPSDCRPCAIYLGLVLTPAKCEKYRAFKDSAPPLDKKPKKDLSCIHRGDVLRLQTCETCSGQKQLKVYACALHTECYLGTKLPDVKKCLDCDDRKSVTIPVEVLNNKKG